MPANNHTTLLNEVIMHMGKRLVRGTLALLVAISLGLGVADAAPISPTDPTTLRLQAGSAVTVSLYQLDSELPVLVTPSSPSRCSRVGTPYYRDVTDCYLAEVGKSVFVVINRSAAVPTLVPPAPAAFPLAAGAVNPFVAGLTTSAYPGQWINTGAGAGADAVLESVATSLPTSATTSVTGWRLTSQDGGMMAVLDVGGQRFIVPGDGTATVAANGIPDVWESLHGGNLNPSEDTDTGPAPNAPLGDGISTFDEYRGALVGGKHVRLDPRLKDLFVYLATGQCATSANPTSLLLAGGYPTATSPSATLAIALPAAAGDPVAFTASGAVFSASNLRGEIIGTAGGRARIVAVLSGTTVLAEVTTPFANAGAVIGSGSWQLTESIFANVYGVLSAERIRVLGPRPNPVNSAEWVDNLVSYGEFSGLVYNGGAAGAATDRVINVNRAYGPQQKGIRALECLDTSVTTPYGFAIGGVGSPNFIGNVVLYTARVVNHITSLISFKAPRKVRYSPMLVPVRSGSTVTDWEPKTLVGDGSPASPAVRNFIISKAMQFYMGMEVGHSLRLTETATNHPHFAPFSGDALDAAITSKPDKSSSGFNTFYIPSVFGIVDQSQLVVK